MFPRVCEDASVEIATKTVALSDATAEDDDLDPFADMEEEDQSTTYVTNRTKTRRTKLNSVATQYCTFIKIF